MPEKRIAVIGAGIAGLAAADWLTAAGFEVTIYEARDRAGGRINTIYPLSSPIPVELGAEFIHGDENETWKILKKHPRFEPAKFPDRHWDFRDGALKQNKHFWEDLDEVMKHLEDVHHDMSFAAFLRRLHHKPQRLRTLAKDFVEGFHAAEPGELSAIALEEAVESAEETNGQKVFRLTGGYKALVDWHVEKLRRRNTTFCFNYPIRRVRWKRGSVEVFTSENKSSTYDAILLTLPLGVLQAKPGEPGAVRFEPELRATKKLFESLQMGNVVKLTLVFKEQFWPKQIFGFLHAENETFLTWWMDKENPVLVAWCGGPKADDLAKLSRQEIVGAAMAELSNIFDFPQHAIEQALLGSFIHDWRKDPFARGAYGFLPVGTTEIPKQLSEPIKGTLFFAGELLSPPGEQGTVHGAMASGKAAARRIFRCV